MLSPPDLRRVYDLAASVGARILSDEAYRWLAVPGGDEFAPPAFELGPLAVSVGTLSKPFGLPGLRLGWIAAAPEIAQRCWHMRDYVSLSPGKLNDALATLALTHRQQMIDRNARIIAANLETAQRWFAAHADLVSWVPPRGGLLSLLRYELEIPSLDLSNHLAREYSVMLAPGSAFGYEGYLRIGIGQDPPVFAAGLERAADCLAAVAAEQGA